MGAEAALPPDLAPPAEVEAEYRRAVRAHYAEGRKGMRSLTSTAGLVGMAVIVAVLPLWQPLRQVFGVGIEWTLPLAIVSGTSIVHAAVAFHRGGADSLWYLVAEDLESVCSVGCAVTVIWASGSALNVFWLYLILYAFDSSNGPHRVKQAMVIYGAGTLALAAGFAWRGAASDAALTLCLAVLGLAGIYAFASSARHRILAEAERNVMRSRFEALLVERERERIARDLHDGVAADLSALIWRARALREAVGQGEAERLADGLVSDARRSLDGLREVVHANLAVNAPWEGFLAALRERVERLCAGCMEWRFDSRDGPEAREVSAELRSHVLRIVQEGVRNAVRHSGGSSVRVELDRGASLWLRIRDDGVGISEELPASSSSRPPTSRASSISPTAPPGKSSDPSCAGTRARATPTSTGMSPRTASTSSSTTPRSPRPRRTMT